MKTTTRSLLIQVATGVAVAATAALMMVPAAYAQNQPSFGFGFSIGPDGKPNVSVGVGNGRPPRALEPVCFYENTRFRGDSFCMDPGSQMRDLGDWTDNVGSFDNPSGLSVTLCSDTRLRGRCATYTTSARSIGGFDGNLASIRVR